MFRLGALAFTLGLAAASATVLVPRAAYAGDLGFSACNAKPTKSDTADAKRSYERGKRLFDERDRGAIDLFRSAYLADCTKHELLVVLSFAYQSDGQLKEALAASELYMQKRGRSLSADDRHTVEERIALLERKLKDQEEAAAAAARPTLLVPAPAPRPAPVEVVKERSPLPWVLVGAGATAIIAGAILVPIGGSKYPAECHDATLFKNGQCTAGQNPAESTARAQDAGTAMGLKRAGFVSVAAGGAAVVGGLIWFALDVTSKPTTTGLRVVPTFSPSSLGFAGTF